MSTQGGEGAEILTYLEYKAFRRITVSTQGGEGGSQ